MATRSEIERRTYLLDVSHGALGIGRNGKAEEARALFGQGAEGDVVHHELLHAEFAGGGGGAGRRAVEIVIEAHGDGVQRPSGRLRGGVVRVRRLRGGIRARRRCES